MPNLVLDGIDIFDADVRALDKDNLIRALFETAANVAAMGLKPSVSKAYAVDSLTAVYPDLVPSTYPYPLGKTQETIDSAEPQVGDLDGGGVYVGKSATTGKDLHAARADEPEYKTYEEALAAAEEMRKQPGRQNAHVPTPDELDENLYQNRNRGKLSGTFNTNGAYPASCYRTSAPHELSSARVQWFNVGGNQTSCGRYVRLPVRLVW
jgi:hypothetical protein